MLEESVPLPVLLLHGLICHQKGLHLAHGLHVSLSPAVVAVVPLSSSSPVPTHWGSPLYPCTSSSSSSSPRPLVLAVPPIVVCRVVGPRPVLPLLVGGESLRPAGCGHGGGRGCPGGAWWQRRSGGGATGGRGRRRRVHVGTGAAEIDTLSLTLLSTLVQVIKRH